MSVGFVRRRVALTAIAAALTTGWLPAYQVPQFPPLGTGLTAEEQASLQSGVDRLAAAVASLKQKDSVGPMSERVADVEVYLDAVKRPLKYDERLWSGRESTPVAVASQTLATGAERAAQLMNGQSPWMAESDLRGDGGSFGFVDTLADYGGPWSFDSETMTNISNQYAAMPSMQIGRASCRERVL